MLGIEAMMQRVFKRMAVIKGATSYTLAYALCEIADKLEKEAGVLSNLGKNPYPHDLIREAAKRIYPSIDEEYKPRKEIEKDIKRGYLGFYKKGKRHVKSPH